MNCLKRKKILAAGLDVVKSEPIKNNSKLLKYKTTTNLYTGIKNTFDYIKKKGPRKFKYHLDLEITNELTPKVWLEKKL